MKQLNSYRSAPVCCGSQTFRRQSLFLLFCRKLKNMKIQNEALQPLCSLMSSGFLEVYYVGTSEMMMKSH